MGPMGAQEFVVILFLVGIAVIPFWKIYTKAGYPGAMGFLMLVPLVNVIMLFVLAFSEWPVLRELQALRQGSRESR
jgi:hypothetical protein